ncbi:unnamed protein product [Linum trigynum]|uniref:LysM domain receptor-like kinase 3 n=1 Tax=Linum trigynum TaxID=586398 RepID=A0AAV2G3Q6_9ROSI
MASPNHLLFLLTIIFLALCKISEAQPFNGSFTCSTASPIRRCDSYLYHPSAPPSRGFNSTDLINQVASIYSVSNDDVEPITHGGGGKQQGYLVSVPCFCRENQSYPHGGYYSYDTVYTLQPGDTLGNSSNTVSANGEPINAGDMIGIELLCGCSGDESIDIVTYLVQENDTLGKIAELLSASVEEIVNLNERLSQQASSLIEEGKLLFVPRKKQRRRIKPGRKKRVGLSLGVLSGISLLLVSSLGFTILKRRRFGGEKQEGAPDKDVEACRSTSTLSLLSYFQKHDFEEATLESEKPRVYTLKEIDKATNGFEESRIIGEGGYGRVYYGLLRGKEVAIKRMKSNRLSEFFAELKALCKVNHINVVELLGYASEEEFMYLVYEYLPNGSLNNHLHDPLRKGHATLSWTARVQIAVDAARGIEYIHDHTKARYVHRDIKTANILLDQGLRAKVADFGLTMLAERSIEEDFVVTRLMGTPGYMAPECVRELQITTKSDVFAFGVVLAELITGRNAIVHDHLQPSGMKSLAMTMVKIFRDQHPEMALETIIDSNLRRSSLLQDVHKMAEVSRWCLSEDPLSRPEMGEVVQMLNQILISSVEWEDSLGGSSQVFSAMDIGR